jgi:hypothetical protein
MSARRSLSPSEELESASAGLAGGQALGAVIGLAILRTSILGPLIGALVGAVAGMSLGYFINSLKKKGSAIGATVAMIGAFASLLGLLSWHRPRRNGD